MGYNSKHKTDCCVGNVNRFMPNFVRRLWMRKEKEIIATLYSPNSFNFLVDGVSVRIEEKTNYPFEDIEGRFRVQRGGVKWQIE